VTNIQFVNPAHLQSVPGFSHFHVFARRKTPQEIDISEKVHEAREAHAIAKAERSKRRQANANANVGASANATGNADVKSADADKAPTKLAAGALATQEGNNRVAVVA
jgi:hypothetical protein